MFDTLPPRREGAEATLFLFCQDFMSRWLSLVGLGSNLGDRATRLRLAAERLATLPGTRVVAQSRHHTTDPIGGPGGQGEFLNAAALLETVLAPQDLLAALQRIEAELGRVRGERWGARSLDLDLLLFGDVQMQTPELTIPHPRMAFRRFVLAPAVEIAAEMRHPELGWTIQRLWDHLDSAPNYVALVGGTVASRRAIVQGAAQVAQAKSLLYSDVLADQNPSDWRELFPSTTSLQDSHLAFASAISDFWVADLVARQIPLPPEIEKTFPTPKILVRLLDVSDDLAQEIPFDGPQLRLALNDESEAIAEVAAAIQAMR